MPTTEQEHLAREASRLLNDATLAKALNEIRLDALTELAEVDAENANEIRRLQAIAGVCLEFVGTLQQYVIAGSSTKADGTGL